MKKQNIAVVTGSSTGIGLKLQYFLQEMNFIHMLQCKIYARDSSLYLVNVKWYDSFVKRMSHIRIILFIN